MSAAALTALTVVVAGLALRPAPPRRDLSLCAEPKVVEPVETTAGRRTGRWRRTQPPRPDDTARWCTDLARAVRSGSTLTAAVRDTRPPEHAFASLASVRLALDRGTRLADAIDQAGADDADVQLALTVVRACAEHGGPPGEPLDRAAATLRARAADLADRRTHSAQARMSAVVMTWLPAAMLGLLLASSAPARAAVASPAGATAVAVGAALNSAGWRWMNRIIGGRR
ncbi:MAG TPA: type II secretion system F family protein [Ilumatobacter sp.]|nr:type II secretion system F family protein [Ilumatobacter sp.]